jgi:hypothetical protein
LKTPGIAHGSWSFTAFQQLFIAKPDSPLILAERNPLLAALYLWASPPPPMDSFQHCPPEVEDLAEDYCLDRLDLEAAQAFEDHYLICPPCATVAAETMAFVQAFRETASN